MALDRVEELRLCIDLGKRILARRTYLKASQRDVAEAAGMPQTVFCALERGRVKRISPYALYTLAAAMSCQISDLFPPLDGSYGTHELPEIIDPRFALPSPNDPKALVPPNALVVGEPYRDPLDEEIESLLLDREGFSLEPQPADPVLIENDLRSYLSHKPEVFPDPALAQQSLPESPQLDAPTDSPPTTPTPTVVTIGGNVIEPPREKKKRRVIKPLEKRRGPGRPKGSKTRKPAAPAIEDVPVRAASQPEAPILIPSAHIPDSHLHTLNVERIRTRSANVPVNYSELTPLEAQLEAERSTSIPDTPDTPDTADTVPPAIEVPDLEGMDVPQPLDAEALRSELLSSLRQKPKLHVPVHTVDGDPMEDEL